MPNNLKMSGNCSKLEESEKKMKNENEKSHLNANIRWNNVS